MEDECYVILYFILFFMIIQFFYTRWYLQIQRVEEVLCVCVCVCVIIYKKCKK
jgi:amino acid transporter